MSREPNEMDEYSDYIDGPEPDSTGLNTEADPDEWQDRRYSGSLIEDAAAVVALGRSLAAKMAEPAPEDIFTRAKRLNAEQSVQQQSHSVFGSLSATDEIREHLCGGHYSNRAQGKPY